MSAATSIITGSSANSASSASVKLTARCAHGQPSGSECPTTRPTRMTARVIQDVAADVIGIVEAEDRPALVRFNKELLGGLSEHFMLVDGNDERGIDLHRRAQSQALRAGADGAVEREHLRAELVEFHLLGDTVEERA